MKKASLVVIRLWSANYNEKIRRFCHRIYRWLTQFITHEMEL